MGQSTSKESHAGFSDTEREIEATRGQNATNFAGAAPSILDNIASVTHVESIIRIGGIPSINFGLEDLFSYEHWAIPELKGKRARCFKLNFDPFGRAQVELRKTDDLNNVVALSYAWGEEELTERAVGHYTGDVSPDEGVCKIILGKEWSTPDFVSVLAKLSANSWLWMDQIARQPGEATESIISTFSTVYSRCSVVVLLPGPDSAKELVRLFGSHVAECAWYLPKLRWFTRVWTRQEALYARRIRVVHVGRKPGPCIPRSSNNSELLTQDRPAFSNLGEFLSTKMNSPDEITDTAAVLVLKVVIAQVAFLLGIQVAYANNSPTLSRSLNRLAETKRKTTDPKDLILSVWPGVDFPRPIENWKSAFTKVSHFYESHFQCTLPCAIPKGATHDTAVNTLTESPSGEVPGIQPSVRSLYSRFQYGQTGVLISDRGTSFLRVSDERVTIRSFPSLDDPCAAIGFVARFTQGLPVWVIQAWWRNILNASDDQESEYLHECGTEAGILFLVLSTRLYDALNAGRALNTRETGEIEEKFRGATISAARMAGLLVMCSTGAWGRDPEQLAPCACITTLGNMGVICAGWPGTYNLAFGVGAGIYGCMVTPSGEVYVRAVIPIPWRPTMGNFPIYPVIGFIQTPG